MHERTTVVPVRLANGTIVHVEVSAVGGEEEVASNVLSFDSVVESLEGIAGTLAGALARVGPDKATIEFGVEISLEAGSLTALLAKGSSKANLKISLQWSRELPKP